MTDVLLDAVAEVAERHLTALFPGQVAELCWAYASLGHWGPISLRLKHSAVKHLLQHYQVSRSCGGAVGMSIALWPNHPEWPLQRLRCLMRGAQGEGCCGMPHVYHVAVHVGSFLVRGAPPPLLVEQAILFH